VFGKWGAQFLLICLGRLPANAADVVHQCVRPALAAAQLWNEVMQGLRDVRRNAAIAKRS
tara:strand:- start:860 stop:1039 length:180 start_codon:yes stop_codon:yes gene_type:complete